MVHGTSHVLDAVVVATCGAATVPAGLRWLRVAQREHYLADAASRFALRWWRSSPLNILGLLVAAAGVFLGTRWPATALATAVVAAGGPFGLGVRGRTSALAWTRRLRTLAVTWAALQAVVLVAGVVTGVGPIVAGAGALAAPALVDAACALTAPFERRAAGRYVRRATDRLRRVQPTVVAITGSYGKTTTKGYVAHLVSGSKVVVASPASFNNKAGLARAVNEQLADGTEVFVAEMGTYGRGEIAELCRWVRPDVSVITAIGPVHLERFHTEDAIVEAKSEILGPASGVVLPVDDERLASLADRAAAEDKHVWRVSVSDPSADVCVEPQAGRLRVRVRGELTVEVPVDARPSNVACAVAVALQLGVPLDVVVSRLPTLPSAPHRLEPAPTANGRCLVLDDTYNANPAGARVALEALERLSPPGARRAVVTPGMVELGRRQADENSRFAAAAAATATDIVVVGRTNRRALVSGARAANGAEVVVVARREHGVAWVRDHLGEGDVALFENDLPDHYP
ncbi:MAG TPA: UDP-N-acetylmuramoyl-tripeptide--D-alanyl-D-alanine ligase [Acidimicrobiales bacterium]|nr:UDP-N-acetylmuramoyl-tripeptide--D-alanyl-D-alanine ligase [Acidimicrobiales bacterium]